MFETLSNRLETTFARLRGRGLLNEQDIEAALKEVRLALIEADVEIMVVKHFLNICKDKAKDTEILKSIKPGEMVVKIVNDAMVEVLGNAEPLNLSVTPPAVILMCGLQGSGKTTTSGKLAKLLIKDKKRVMLASADVYRPAAQEQLNILAQKTGALSLEIISNEKPSKIAQRALSEAKKQGADILIFDTAGRLELDEALMNEIKEIKQILNPSETMFVADSLTGQIASHVAKSFNEQLGITGIVLTRLDGDGRGGAALSTRFVSGAPIKFLGTSESLDGLEVFRPEGMASRILGMGDVVAMVEKMQNAISLEETEDMQAQFMSGKAMDLSDMKKQLNMVLKLTKGGGIGSLLGMIPGLGKIKKEMSGKVDEKAIKHQIAIIDSMTKAERKNPSILNAKRRVRIANGSGTNVMAVNKLIKGFLTMQKATKKMSAMDPRQMQQLARQFKGGNGGAGGNGGGFGG